MDRDRLIIVRGAGDLATGTIHRLFQAGFPVIALETQYPAAIRRQVSFCEAVWDKSAEVEGVKAVLADNTAQAFDALDRGMVPVIVDPEGTLIRTLKPAVVVDGILAKKNCGTSIDMAPLTIALGPGFTAGIDVDVVIETKRGHNLGRVIREGQACRNTGIPGNIGGYTIERVIRSPEEGILKNIAGIGDAVEKGQVLAEIRMDNGGIVSVAATITGVLRGLLRDGYRVSRAFKIADIDPRKEELQNCFTISDKARCISGGVLETICRYFHEKDFHETAQNR